MAPEQTKQEDLEQKQKEVETEEEFEEEQKEIKEDDALTAEDLAKEQRNISVSEFFEKNRHLLGYDNKIKALLIIIKEAVDNSLDACEEASILPEIYVKIEEVEKEKYKLVVKDNGPGIVKEKIPDIFGRLLYGSKFHRLKQSRGQQGLGISMAVLYSQLTTGKPSIVLSSTGSGKTHRYTIKLDVKHNQPQILESDVSTSMEWRGTQITLTCEGIYREHKQSVLEYLRETAISNPYAHIVFDSPNGRVEFQRGADELPPKPKAIQPHLHGVELGIMSRMMHQSKARSVVGFLMTEFSRVGSKTAAELLLKANIDPKISAKRVTDDQVSALIKAINETPLMRPPTDCLSPLGPELVKSGLKKEVSPEWVDAVTRPPAVYRGWPFQIEVGIAYGGSITEPMIMRFANRVPLLYQAGACAITKSIQETDWKRYGMNKNLEEAPVVIFVHICSVWVPFTSESKEAVASYPMIVKEIKLALQECARKLQFYISRRFRSEEAAKKKEMFRNYSEELAASLSNLTGMKKDEIFAILTEVAEEMYATGEIDTGADEKDGSQKKRSDEEDEPVKKREYESGEEDV
jgi:DNA topoisomerase-6 subunit B